MIVKVRNFYYRDVIVTFHYDIDISNKPTEFRNICETIHSALRNQTRKKCDDDDDDDCDK